MSIILTLNAAKHNWHFLFTILRTASLVRSFITRDLYAGIVLCGKERFDETTGGAFIVTI